MAKPGPQKINRYGLDFKLRAVLMSEQPGVQVKDVAESLCIHPFMLSKWRKQVRDGVLAGKVPQVDPAPLGDRQRNASAGSLRGSHDRDWPTAIQERSVYSRCVATTTPR